MTVRLELGGLSFEWDTEKAWTNERKHGVDFDEAASSFLDPRSLTIRDDLHSALEERWIMIGVSSSGRLLRASYTQRDRWLRIIGCRTASARERHEYAPKRRRR